MRMNYVKPQQESTQDELRDTGILEAMTRGFSGDFEPTLGNRRTKNPNNSWSTLNAIDFMRRIYVEETQTFAVMRATSSAESFKLADPELDNWIAMPLNILRLPPSRYASIDESIANSGSPGVDPTNCRPALVLRLHRH